MAKSLRMQLVDRAENGAIVATLTEDFADEAMALAVYAMAVNEVLDLEDGAVLNIVRLPSSEITEEMDVVSLPDYWEKYGKFICHGEKETAAVFASIIEPLYDAEGRIWDKVISAPDAGSGERFLDAVIYCVSLLQDVLNSARQAVAAVDWGASVPHALVFTKFVKHWEVVALANPECWYGIIPSANGYNVQCVPDGYKQYGQRRPFPEEWAGKPVEDLQKLTKVSDVVFCHKKCYCAAAKSRAGAKALATAAAKWRVA